VTGHRLDDPGFDLRWEQEIFFFFIPVQTGPSTNATYSTVGTGLFLGVKRSRRGVKHPLPPNAEVKNDLCSPSVPSSHVTGWPYVNGYYSLDFGIWDLTTYSLLDRY